VTTPLVDVEQLLSDRARRPEAFASLRPREERGLRVVTEPVAALAQHDDEDDAPSVGASDAPPEIWLYGSIGAFGIYAQDVRWALDQLSDAKRIKLRIHSLGGSVFEGAAIYTLFQQSGKVLDVQIDGVAFSDACNIAMVGHSIAISPRGFMMIHRAWDCACGNGDQMRKVAGLLDKIDPSIAALYEKRLGVNRAAVLAMMAEETWWNAEEAVAAGVADRILEASAVPETLPPLDDVGEAVNHAPREVVERFVRSGARAPEPPRSLAAEVAAHLRSQAAAQAPPSRIPIDTVRAVEAALGRLQP